MSAYRISFSVVRGRVLGFLDFGFVDFRGLHYVFYGILGFFHVGRWSSDYKCCSLFCSFCFYLDVECCLCVFDSDPFFPDHYCSLLVGGLHCVCYEDHSHSLTFPRRTHETVRPVRARYGVSWLNSLIEVLPSWLLACVYYRAVYDRDISRVWYLPVPVL